MNKISIPTFSPLYHLD